MTVTTSRPTSRFRWVPAAAGWIIGVIASLSLLSSVSPLLRHIIRVPREFINDYIFNFPDTSFAWAFVLGLLAAALAARKRIAWWILVFYMAAASVWNALDLLTGGETEAVDIGEVIGLVFHVAAIGFLLLAYREFWARVRRGALLKAAATLVAGMAIGTVVGWGLLELSPGTLAREDRFWYALNRVGAFAGAGADAFTGHPHVFVNALLGLFGALALMVAAIVLFQSQRADNALTGEDESAIRDFSRTTARTIHWATSRPAATSRWCSRPTAARRSPIASRSACVWPVATRSGTRAPGRRPSAHGWTCARPMGGLPV